MIKWQALKPMDTLFFKGALPMVMGENHTSEFRFPPSCHTIAGAVRTAVLRQNNIPFKDYCGKDFSDESIISAIGRAGNDPPFTILGPLLEKSGTIYIPAPYSWYLEKDDKNKKEAVSVYRSKPVESSLVVTPYPERLYVAKGARGELTTAGGKWLKLDDFLSQKAEITICETTDFYCQEQRTGIALEKNRSVRKSHLYTFTHARLGEDVRIIFGIRSKAELPLSDSGMLRVGGEQRMGYYEPVIVDIDIDISDWPKASGEPSGGSSGKSRVIGLFMNLSNMVVSDSLESSLVACGKIQYIGGWDMKKGFHKPAIAYYPPGSIFNKHQKNLITLTEE